MTNTTTTRTKTTKQARLWATYEIVSSFHAVVSFSDTNGEWQGAGRVEIRRPDRDALIEECYRVACVQAACKGMELDRFSEGVE